MPVNRTTRKVIILLFCLALSACNLPGLGTPEVSTPTSPAQANAAHTAAAETIIAQLTQVSNPATPSPPPTAVETPTLAATETLEEAGETGGLATQEETSVPEATATAVETTPAAPTATLDAEDPKYGLGGPNWQDNFETGENWYLYFDKYASFEVRDGNLLMISYQTGPRNAWMLTQPEPDNYYLEITAQPQTCEGLDRYGVIVRSDAVEGYLFAFSCDGQYSFRSWNGKRADVLVDWTSSEHILAGPDQANRLGLRLYGDQFTLYANGKLLAEVSDGSYPEGGFGVFIGSEKTEDFVVQISEVVYWDLP